MTKIISNTQLLFLTFVFVSIGIVTSCKKDSMTNTGKVELLSFGPTGAMHGDTLTFIGNNLDKVTEIDLTGGVAVPQANFLKQTPETILILVPKETEQGFVTLKTPEGDIVSKSKLNLEVPVKITSMTAGARPGEDITITGEYLNWVTSVTFSNDKKVDSFVSKSMDKLVVTVPMDAQTGKLIISTGGTEPLDIESDSTLNVTLPSISSISPNPVKHADNLTISGANLDLTKGVLFVGETAAVTTFVSQSANQLVVKVPAGARQGKIKLVANSLVTVEAKEDLLLVLPAITALSPAKIEHEGNLTITGSNLDLTTKILFNGDSIPVTAFISKTPTQIVVKAPAKAKKGKIILSVINSSLTVESSQLVGFVDDLPELAPLAYAFYIDKMENNWQDWGWGRTADYSNTENVRDGKASLKLDYTGEWSGLKFANTSVSTASYSELVFSIFGTPGTGGKKLSISPKEGTTYNITIEEGKWVEYKIKKADIGNPATITELTFQNQTWKGLIYLDHVGFR